MVQIPQHLQKLLMEEADTDNLPVDQFWVNNLDIKLKLIVPSNGNDLFRVQFSGIRYDDGIIGPNKEIPLVVDIIDEGGKLYSLFDQRNQGFESIMNESRIYDNPVFENYFDPFGESIFNIYFFCNSSTDFEDEFEIDANGFINTHIYGKKNIEWLCANAFDYIVVFIQNIRGHVTKLIELELT